MNKNKSRLWQMQFGVPRPTEAEPDKWVMEWRNVSAPSMKEAMEIIEQEYEGAYFFGINERGTIDYAFAVAEGGPMLRH